MSGPAGREFGEGPLARAAALIHQLLVLEALLLVAAAPGLAGLVLLGPDPSNLPLVAVCALPLGPAFSATLYALHHRRADLADLHPAAAFWRGYRLNLWPVLRLWVPWLAWLAVVAVNLTHLAAGGVPQWWAVPLVLAAGVGSLWAANATVIVSLYAFRSRDVARLAAYFLIRTPRVAVAHAALAIVAAAVVAISSEAVLALLGSVLATVALRHSRPLLDHITRDFVAPTPAPPPNDHVVSVMVGGVAADKPHDRLTGGPGGVAR